MPSSNQNFKLAQKLSRINQIIDANDFDAAVTALEGLSKGYQLTGAQNKTLNHLKLKVFNRLQWLVEAEPIACKLVACAELDSDQSLEIALFYILTAKVELAESYLRRALSLNKQSVLLASELAILFEQQGKREKALSIYNKIFSKMLGKKEVNAAEARVLNRLAGLRPFDDEEVVQIDALCKRNGGGEFEIRLLFGLAKAFAKRNEVDKEVFFLKKANALAEQVNVSSLPTKTIDESRKRLKAIQFLFDRPEPFWMQDYVRSNGSPIFILGMPRSGTTLLEQVLGAHSTIGNSGESRGMGIAFQRRLLSKRLPPEDVVKKLPFMRYKALNRGDSKAIIDYYDRYQGLLSEKVMVTDKELSNIDRVGMILQFYPNAKFIGITRNPLDVCVSIMQHDFSGAYFSSSSLKVVQEYESYYDRFNHWCRLYPSSVFSITYEKLVSDFEGQAKTIIQFLGLPWEETIKEFYLRENSVRTPSLSQVRSNINSGSINKWRQYRELIEPAEKYLISIGKHVDK